MKIIFSVILLSFLVTFGFASASAYEIPGWVKSNAEWWAQDQIDDNTFVSGIEFLVKEGIIQIPETAPTTSQNSEGIPNWIKSNAGWWAQGLISDDDFIKGVEFLVENGILKVDDHKPVEQSHLDIGLTDFKTYDNEELNISIKIPKNFIERSDDAGITLYPDPLQDYKPNGVAQIILKTIPLFEGNIDEQIKDANKMSPENEFYKTKLGKDEAMEGVQKFSDKGSWLFITIPQEDVSLVITFMFYDNAENRQLIQEIKKSYQPLKDANTGSQKKSSEFDIDSIDLKTYENEELNISIKIPKNFIEQKTSTRITLMPDPLQNSDLDGLQGIILYTGPSSSKTIDEKIESAKKTLLPGSDVYKTTLGKYDAYETFLGESKGVSSIIVTVPLNDDVAHHIFFAFYDSAENRQIIEEIKSSYQYTG